MSHINTEELSDLLFEAMQKYMSGEIKLREGTDIYTKKIEALIDQALHQQREKGIKFALESVNMSLRGRGCRFEFDEKRNIVFFSDHDELGQVEDVSRAFGRCITRELANFYFPTTETEEQK